MRDDARHIATGSRIPAENYCDQPYAVLNDDGSWLCVLTTGRGREGSSGQHVVATVSRDMGQSWSDPVEIEPAGGPEASWAQPLKVPSGRIYVFYTYNRDNIREVRGDDPPFSGGVCRRVDSLGAYAYRFSDDGGHSWSANRYEIPVRPFDIDRENPYWGEIRFFWGVGKPFLAGQAAYVPASKVGGFGPGFFTRSEGMFLRGENLLTEPEPGRHRWQTLPLGPGGLVSGCGRTECAWDCDPGCLRPGKLHHLVSIVDGAAGVISFVVDGVLCDGGTYRRYGWGRLPPYLGGLNGSRSLRVAPSLNGRIHRVRLYERYLRTSEAVQSFNAGP